MNRLETLENVLKGVAPLPDFNELMGSLDKGAPIQAVEKGQEINVERRRTEHLDKGEGRRLAGMLNNVPDKGQKFEKVGDIAVARRENPRPHALGEGLSERHADKVQKAGHVFVEVKRIHLGVNTTAAQGGNQVFDGRADKDETGNMTVGFHGSSEGLLRNLGKGVDVVNEDPADGLGLGVVQRHGRHLPNKEAHMGPNGLDAPVLVRRQDEALVRCLLPPLVRVLPPSTPGIVLQELLDHCRLSGPGRARQKEVTRRIHQGHHLRPDGLLAYQVRHSQ